MLSNFKTIICVFLILFLAEGQIAAQDTLIRSGHLWQYLDDGSDPGVSWTELHFPCDHWSEGPSPLGYGYKELGTKIAYGADTTSDEKSSQKFITAYFRKQFFLEKDSSYVAYKINYKRDDGAIFNINNAEVIRSNMPSGRITYKTQSTQRIQGSDEDLIHSKYIEPTLLRKGANIIAIEVHQRKKNSTDIILDFELIGIKNATGLNEFLKKDHGNVNNAKLELLDIKHELNEESIRNEFGNKIIRAQWWLLGFGVLLFGILSGLFYRYYQEQYKVRSLANEEKKDYEERLKNKSQESINHSVASIRTKNFFKEIKLELLQIAAVHSNTKNDLSKLINRIDTQSQSEEDWEKMKLHLDSLYSGFFERLSHQYPVLSQHELKHCGFIKLRLDTKEISQILRIDPKSVQAARYRIKKKMNLAEGEDLRTIICAF